MPGASRGLEEDLVFAACVYSAYGQNVTWSSETHLGPLQPSLLQRTPPLLVMLHLTDSFASF